MCVCVHGMRFAGEKRGVTVCAHGKCGVYLGVCA